MILIAVRQEVNTLDKLVVVHELEFGVDIVEPSNNKSIVACFISLSQDKLLMKLLQMSERKLRFRW